MSTWLSFFYQFTPLYGHNQQIGCTDFCVKINDEIYNANNFLESFEQYIQTEELYVEYVDQCKKKRFLVFNRDGCFTISKENEFSDEKYNNVFNDKIRKYDLFGNKGFYRDIELFISSIDRSYM